MSAAGTPQAGGSGLRWVRSPHVLPLAVVFAAVVAANLPSLAHLVTTDPLVINSNLVPPAAATVPGLPYIDPNAGFTAQALGHLAATDWLHGHVPWWNPFEGIGAPLAGEMQSGAFFPTTFLLLLPRGWTLVEITLELVAGWSTYFLVRRLGVGRVVATASGVAFGLCGTFALLAHAPIRPMALLPLCLLGVERALDAARDGRRGGWRLLAVALALSVLAGFPEASFIDALFVVMWAAIRVCRLERVRRRPALGRLALGAVVGLLLAAPLAVAFLDYLPDAYIGGHGSALAHASSLTRNLPQLVLPWSLGPIDGFRSSSGSAFIVTGTPGYLAASLIAPALVGLLGTRHRGLRIGLGAWVLVCLLRTFGFPPVVDLLADLPGVNLTAFNVWADATWELAVIVLAALGIDDLARGLTARRSMFAALAITGGLAAWAGATAWPLMASAAGDTGNFLPSRLDYPAISLVMAGSSLAVLALGTFLMGAGSPRRRVSGRVLFAAMVGLDALLLFSFTNLSAPPPAAVPTGSAAWLAAHLGTSRFATLGPIAPDYGSYFGVAEVNVNDLPVPKAWDTYISAELDPNAPPGEFSGTAGITASGPTPAQELASHLFAYESVGVRDVVEDPTGQDADGQPFPPPGSPPWPAGPRLVYRDVAAEIWQLPSAAPLFTAPPGCAVRSQGWDTATVHCRAATTLLRRVLFLPGWSATDNGASVAVHEARAGTAGLVQEVGVPAGTTTVHFDYLPPHEWPALGGAVLGLLALTVPLAVRRPRRSAPGGGLEPPTSGSKGRRSAD